MGGRKGRNGLFPATACIKIAGYYGKFTVDVIFWHHLCFVSFISKMNKGKERETEGERGRPIESRVEMDCCYVYADIADLWRLC